VKLPNFISRKHGADASRSGFAATVVEEAPPDSGGDILINDTPPTEDKPLEELTTIGHIGRYALKYRIGEGGLGTVYVALDPLLGRAIAVKTLHVEVPPEQRAAVEASFLQEARAAARLNHPHIVTVHDAGSSDEGLYIAMERLKGADLRQLLHEGWKATPHQAAQIVRRVADALAYAHEKGVVHCDIKPANIFMVGRNSPKVLDFGIARVAKGPDGAAEAALAAGSPCYMAPEQLRGEAVDGRSDVYALGSVLYELLTGLRAFQGASLDEIVDAALNQTPTPVLDINPEAPRMLAAIAQRAMAKDPAQRFPSARQMSQALRMWLSQQPSRSRSRRPRARPSPLLLFVGGVGVTLSGLAVAWLLWERAPVQPEVAASPVPAAVAPPASAAASAAELPASAPIAVAEAASAPEPAASAAAAAATPAEATSPLAPLVAAAPAPAPRASTALSPRERRARETRERETRAATAPIAAPATGQLLIAISPWGEIEVDGAPAGTSPPLNRLSLPEGSHTITVRNADFPPYTTTVRITADQPLTLKHRFGS